MLILCLRVCMCVVDNTDKPFSPRQMLTHRASRNAMGSYISGCCGADGGGSAKGRESFKRCFKTHYGLFDAGSMGCTRISRMAPVKWSGHKHKGLM